MMNYEIFKEVVADTFKDYLPVQYKDMELILSDLDWLAGKLDKEDYRKLENYILNLWLKNDELLFRVGFRYAWSLFNECTPK